MAKHDIVLLNTTSSGFETDLGTNVARIKGDADDLFQVNNASGVDKFAVSSTENSMIIGGDLTLTGNLSSSLNSTASFGKIDVTNLVGDASQMTNTNEQGHVSSSAQLASRISGAFQAGFVLEGENRVISGSVTSTGSFTKVVANVYSGDASDMFNVNEAGHFSGSAQLASDISGSFTSGFNFSGKISGSSTSTGSFGRLDVTSKIFVTDASETTGVAGALPGGIFSSSAQLASNISGAFTTGFEVIQDSIHGTGNVISHSASESGSVTASLSSKGFFISGSVTSTGSFGHFNMGDYGGFGTTSLLTGSGARVPDATHGGKITILDTSELTGLSTAGFISSSGQIASQISGAFTSGFGFGDPIGTTFINYPSPYNAETHPTASRNIISGSVTSTGSFGRLDNISKIVANASDTTGLSIPTGTVSGSIQLAADISGSFNKGFEFDNSISGSVTSTGSFSRLNFNSLSVTDLSGITGHEAGHVSGSGNIAADISGSFNKGFGFTGTISASSDSTLRVQALNLGGTFTFGSTNLTKKWDTSYIRLASFGASLGAAISGAFNAGFGFEGTISGSATSTGSFNKIKSQRLFVKEMVGKRRPISGSMDHDNYISASYKSDSHGKITIPVFGRGHTVNTQQFTATGSMESQKYRARAGQLFVDNFGRLNMTVQTGSEVAVAGAWEAGPTGFFTSGPGNSAATGTPNAIIQSSPWGYQRISGSAIYDGIGWTRVSDVTAVGGSFNYANCSIGTVDAALFLRHSAGLGNGTNTGKYGSFPNVGAHTTFQEDWDGIGWRRGPSAHPHVLRNGTSGKVGSVNSHIAFNGDDYPTNVGTSTWNGVTWQEVGPHTPTHRDGGGGFGGVYDGVVAGGASPNNTCVDEWNGVSWSTATALPTGQSQGGGAGPQTAGIIMGGSPAKEVQEYNGTSWSEGTSIPVNFSNHATGGSAGKAFTATSFCSYFWTGGFVTGSADTYNKFSQNPSGRYLLTKKLQANYSPGCAGGGSSPSGEDFGGGY